MAAIVSKSWPVACAGLIVFGLVACKPPVVHAPDRKGASRSDLRDVKWTWTRHRVVAEDIDVHATLWDAEVVGAKDFREDVDSESRRDRLQRWSERYLEQTTFTVVLEFANRPPPPQKGNVEAPDPLLVPDDWSFDLQLDQGAKVKPARTEVQALDRFPTKGGGYHYRMVYAVYFPKSLHGKLPRTSAAKKPVNVKLRIRNRTKFGNRTALGWWIANKGIVLHWRVSKG